MDARSSVLRPALVLATIVALLAGCSGSASPAPSASAGATPSGAPSPPASPTPAPSPSPVALAAGSIAVTVTDDLRVRSEPRVADDSIKYDPLLPEGTELIVLGGPVSASGYAWYHVEPVGIGLQGATDGWVAAADHDGTPWIAYKEQLAAPAIEFAKATLARAAADPADARTIAAAIDAFGIDLYRAMLADPSLSLGTKNVVMSPTSVAIALAMARAGAEGQTATQMDDVLRAAGWDELGTGLNALDRALASRDWEDEWAGEKHALTLRITNAAFGQDGYPLEPEYLDRIAESFGAGLGLLDFATDPDGARRAINAWVSEQTRRRIPELLGPPDVTDATRLVLVNAMYLKAEWERPFHVESTKDDVFTRLDGSRVTVPTMRGQETWPYAKGDGWRATELGYIGREGSRPLVMTLVVPDDLAAFEASLTGERLAAITTELAKQWDVAGADVACDSMCGCHGYDVALSMPRFGIDTRASLKRILSGLGMVDAFDPDAADFDGITSADPTLHIGFVIHQANVDVDEKGTEAAAATAVGMDTGGCTGSEPSRVIELRLDRPFLFAIRDVETGAVLFLGRVVDPSAKS